MHEKHPHDNEQQPKKKKKVKLPTLVSGHSQNLQWKQVHFTL